MSSAQLSHRGWQKYVKQRCTPCNNAITNAVGLPHESCTPRRTPAHGLAICDAHFWLKMSIFCSHRMRLFLKCQQTICADPCNPTYPQVFLRFARAPNAGSVETVVREPNHRHKSTFLARKVSVPRNAARHGYNEHRFLHSMAQAARFGQRRGQAGDGGAARDAQSHRAHRLAQSSMRQR